MSDYKTINIDKQDFVCDLEPDVVFNFTQDHVKFIYTKSSNGTKISRTVTTKQLDSKEKLKIQSVLCCKSTNKEPILVIVASDEEVLNRIYCYNMEDQQVVQVNSKTTIKHDVTQASLTKEAFDVTFMDKTSADVIACYALIIGTSDGNTVLLLLDINEANFEAEVMSTEMIKDKNNPDLGHVTAIHILPPDKADRRMGHSDPQILLGYSKGGILIYRFRAKIYAMTATRLRAPVNLSEFAEFPNYPITRLSCVRSYNSLAMTVVFSQEKPHDNEKYQYRNPYVKLVETHGDSTQIARKIIASDDADSKIVEAKLLVSNLITQELDNMIQLSIVFECTQDFQLSLWHISSKKIHQQIDVTLEKNECMDLMSHGTNSNMDDLNGFCKHTPQKLVQRLLEYKKDPHQHHHQDIGIKRKHDDEGLEIEQEHEEEKIVKKGRVTPAHSDEENLEEKSDTQHSEIDKDEDVAMEDVIETSQDIPEEPIIDHTFDAEPTGPTTDRVDEKETLNEESIELEGATLVVGALESKESVGSIEQVEPTKLEEPLKAEEPAELEEQAELEEPVELEKPSEAEESAGPAQKDSIDAVIETLIEKHTTEVSTVESIVEKETTPVVERNIDTTQEQPADLHQENRVEYLKGNIVDALLDEAVESVLENLIHSAEEKATSQATEEPVAQTQLAEESEVNQTTSADLDTAIDTKTITQDTETTEATEVDVVQSNSSTTEQQLVEGADIIQEATEESKNEISQDYVLVDHEDITENVDNGSPKEQQEGTTFQQDQPSQEVHFADENFLDADNFDQPEEPTQEQTERKSEAETTSEGGDYEDSYEGEDMDYGQDYGDDGENFYNLSEEELESNEISESTSGEEEEVEEKEMTEATEEPYNIEAIVVGEMIESSEDTLEEEELEKEEMIESAEEEEMIENTEDDLEQEQEEELIEFAEDNIEEEEYEKEEIIEDKKEDIQEEQENDQAYLEVDQSEPNEIIEDKEEEALVKDDYDEVETPTIVDDLSDVGSIQQSFVPASNTTNNDTTHKENSDSNTTHTASTIDYIPVMEQDLFRLLEEANIPLHSNNNADITTNNNVDNVNLNNNDTTTGTEANVVDSFISLSPKEFELTQEEKTRLEMEEKQLESENIFCAILDQNIGVKDLTTFMNQPLISKEQLDLLGNACWYSHDPRVKLLLVQYCDKHKLGEEVVSLCRLLMNESVLDCFYEPEESELKAIYRKYYKYYPSYNDADKVINIFTQEGRHQLLQKEASYLKFKNFTHTSSNDQKKNDNHYMRYYGFGFIQKI